MESSASHAYRLACIVKVRMRKDWFDRWLDHETVFCPRALMPIKNAMSHSSRPAPIHWLQIMSRSVRTFVKSPIVMVWINNG